MEMCHNLFRRMDRLIFSVVSHGGGVAGGVCVDRRDVAEAIFIVSKINMGESHKFPRLSENMETKTPLKIL